MKVVQRWRYYCDHCKKAGGSKWHMLSHESACTLNPARVCKMCKQLEDFPQTPMHDLLAVLPDPAGFMTTVVHEPDGFFEDKRWVDTFLNVELFKPVISAAVIALREAAHGCPVCMMAALRQKKIPVPLAEGFDYKKELASLWSEINADQHEHY